MPDTCGICRDDLVDDVKTLDCAHAFHSGCIDSWTVRVARCPFCRAHVDGAGIVDHVRAGVIMDEDSIIEYIVANTVSHTDVVALVNKNNLSSVGLMRVVDSGCSGVDVMALICAGLFNVTDIVWIIFSEKISIDDISILLERGTITLNDLERIVSVYVSYFTKHNVASGIADAPTIRTPEWYAFLLEFLPMNEPHDAIPLVYSIIGLIGTRLA